MILSGPKIAAEVDLGRIVIQPFNAAHVNPASVDLTLGPMFATYRRWVSYFDDPNGGRACRIDAILDSKSVPDVDYRVIPEDGIVLYPGIGYLMHTAERVMTEHYVPVIDGKSSIGRLFVSVHETAGYGDPGYDGQYTLEVTCLHPVRLYKRQRICQMRFHHLDGEHLSYKKTGHYIGETATGPVPSRAFAQFKK